MGRAQQRRQTRPADGLDQSGANPSLYFGMSLELTSPLNILVGMPACVHVAQRVLS
ncbi:MAG TPA: sodium-dependent bicarbonate transport family permease [Burkholderiaceae bacterium]|nr:sodium-dependent bicarbonate transport family permease [Burkholderiaceae bacterium]